MADAKPSLSATASSEGSGPKAKPTERKTAGRQTKRQDFSKKQAEDRPHELMKDDDYSTVTQLRSGTSKEVRK